MRGAIPRKVLLEESEEEVRGGRNAAVREEDSTRRTTKGKVTSQSLQVASATVLGAQARLASSRCLGTRVSLRMRGGSKIICVILSPQIGLSFIMHR